MPLLPRFRLSDAEKDALLAQQQDLIEQQALRITELEALVGRSRKTSNNSHVPPSKDGFGRGKPKTGKASKKPRPVREGKARPLTEMPDRTERVMAVACGHCGTDVSGAAQRCRHRYDHIDLPPIHPVVTRVELFGGRCGGCGRRYRAAAPAGMAPGTPFGPGIRAVLTYLHQSHHVSFERLSRLAAEMFGLTISHAGIANLLRRLGMGMAEATAAIRAKLRTARIIASDETTTRTNGVTQWQWVFISDKAVLHEIAPRRARSVAQDVLGEHRPDVWISDRYGGQQELGGQHQVCLAHVLRDVQYAIDCGDTVFAPKVRDHLRRAEPVKVPAMRSIVGIPAEGIGVGRRRRHLKDTTLASYAARADLRLSRMMLAPVAHPAGKALLKQIKAWRAKFFVFLTNRDVPATNNVSEREIRPSVVFRKVTGGFRSDWGAAVHAGYRSVTGTARLQGQSALGAVRDLVDGRFAIA